MGPAVPTPTNGAPRRLQEEQSGGQTVGNDAGEAAGHLCLVYFTSRS